MPASESDRAARRRLVWLLLTRGDVGAEALRSAQAPPAGRTRPAGGSSSSAPPPPAA